MPTAVLRANMHFNYVNMIHHISVQNDFHADEWFIPVYLATLV